jgi:hypothetical protein
MSKDAKFMLNDDTVVVFFQTSLDDDGYMIEVEYIEKDIEKNATFIVKTREDLKSTLEQLHEHMIELVSTPT